MSDLPPPIPADQPPIMPSYYRDQRKVDADHLRLLSIFSYVSAGIALLGLLFLVFHYSMMRMVFDNPQIWKDPPGVVHRGPPPPDFRAFFDLFRWFYVVFGLWGVVAASLNVASGYFLGQRRHRTFSLVVAGMNCIRVPLGTALGVFTFIVLMRDSVRHLYVGDAASDPTPDKLPS